MDSRRKKIKEQNLFFKKGYHFTLLSISVLSFLIFCKQLNYNFFFFAKSRSNVMLWHFLDWYSMKENNTEQIIKASHQLRQSTRIKLKKRRFDNQRKTKIEELKKIKTLRVHKVFTQRPVVKHWDFVFSIFLILMSMCRLLKGIYFECSNSNKFACGHYLESTGWKMMDWTEYIYIHTVFLENIKIIFCPV